MTWATFHDLNALIQFLTTKKEERERGNRKTWRETDPLKYLDILRTNLVNLGLNRKSQLKLQTMKIPPDKICERQ